MHNFDDLAGRCAAYTLGALRDSNDRTIESLEASGDSSLVKTLQMIQLQKVILSVGMFSIFEASLQARLNCKDGFSEVKTILAQQEEADLNETFQNLYTAINVLKHGRGHSYDKLVAKASIPFRVKLPNEAFFSEGDVSEVSILIEVDDAFVQLCGEVIRDVSEVLRKAGH